jgi:hypothetical protein
MFSTVETCHSVLHSTMGKFSTATMLMIPDE